MADSLNSRHDELHGDHGTYEAETCILNTTDVLLDQMMYSVPVSQLLAGLGSGSTADKAARLLSSVDAMDQMMVLFYQHKGLTDLAGAGDKKPSARPASEYPVYADVCRRLHVCGGQPHRHRLGFGARSGRRRAHRAERGWQLSQRRPLRLGHRPRDRPQHQPGQLRRGGSHQQLFLPDLPGPQGASASATTPSTARSPAAPPAIPATFFTQLGLYWQLHLAYDKGYEYEIYSNYDELFASRFYARVDTYARNTAQAPAPGGVQLALGRDAALDCCGWPRRRLRRT